MRQEFDGSGSHIAYNVGFSFELLLIFVEFIVLAGRSGGSNGEAGRNSGTASWPGTGQEGLPTPASLGEVMHSTRQMLVEQAGDTLLVCLILPSLIICSSIHPYMISLYAFSGCFFLLFSFPFSASVDSFDDQMVIISSKDHFMKY